MKRVRAGEVILSGGAINSPQLLLLSGDFNHDYCRHDCHHGDDDIVQNNASTKMEMMAMANN